MENEPQTNPSKKPSKPSAFRAQLKQLTAMQASAMLAFALFCASSASAVDWVSGAIHPHISKDGEEIVFSNQGAIWKMPRTGGVVSRLTDEPGFDIEPAWSPDKRQIAFIRSTNFSAGTLEIISADGESRELSAKISARDRLFWDASGKRLLGVFGKAGSSSALCWLNLDSGELGPELSAVPGSGRYALSRDGSKIALVETRDKFGVEQNGNNGPQNTVWTISAQGGNRTRLFEFPARIYELEWADDDKALYVVTDVGAAHYDLWRIPLNDPHAGAQKLTFGQGDEDRPTCSENGRWLLFTDNQSGPTQLKLRDLNTGNDQLVGFDKQDFGETTGELHLSIQDADTGDPVTARISVSHIGGKYHAPPDKLYRLSGSDMHFYAEGGSTLTVPEGRYQIVAWRGPEYAVVKQEIEVSANRSSEFTVSMNRWTHQSLEGWYSGESHIHANYGFGHWYNSPRTMLAQCAGEDLIVCNLVVANSRSDGVWDREYFRGGPDPLSTTNTRLHWNEEFRSTIWGHLTLLNLTYLVEPIFTGFAHTTNPHDHPTNADIGHLVHDQDGHVNYTHPAQNINDPYLSAYSAKGLPLDVALGTVDSIDVMGSNHEANMRVWYGLLNCGFRIPASAGTDCFLNRIRSRLPGSVRAYVKVDGSFSYETWVDNLKKGRSFATNGPMFEFSAGGKSIGEAVRMTKPGSLVIEGEVRSQFPLDHAAVIFNGEVIATANPTASTPTTIQINQNIPILHSGWIALRARGPRHPDAGAVLFGHTSPVYVEVEGNPNDAREDAQYFIKWIDRLWSDIQARDRIPSRHRDHVEEQITTARSVYQKIANQ